METSAALGIYESLQSFFPLTPMMTLKWRKSLGVFTQICNLDNLEDNIVLWVLIGCLISSL